MKRTITPGLPVVNRDELIDRMMGNWEMAERMLGKFLDSARESCDLLESTVRYGDKAAVASIAHRHKGAAQTMAIHRVARLAAELEQGALTEPTSKLLEMVDQMRSLHEEVRDSLGNEPITAANEPGGEYA